MSLFALIALVVLTLDLDARIVGTILNAVQRLLPIAAIVAVVVFLGLLLLALMTK